MMELVELAGSLLESNIAGSSWLKCNKSCAITRCAVPEPAILGRWISYESGAGRPSMTLLVHGPQTKTVRVNRMRFPRTTRIAAGLALTGLVAACGGGDLSARKDEGPRSGPSNRYDPEAEGLFGEGGFSLGRLARGGLFGGDSNETNGSAAPVNKYLWQASLDTISFMPLASTDPFTGVIATDWSSTEAAPGERFKVTVYLSSPELAATSVKVAVYRQVRDEKGGWIQTAVDPATPRKLEDAILTRARQMRVAELEKEEAS